MILDNNANQCINLMENSCEWQNWRYQLTVKIPMNKKDGKESEKKSKVFPISTPKNNTHCTLHGSELETIEEGSVFSLT